MVALLKIFDISRFLLDSSVLKNPLLKIQLWALRIFGYMIFNHQYVVKLHCFRGTVFTVSFVLFNVSQYIDLYYKLNDVNEATSNAATTLLFTTCVFRMFNFYWNRTRYVNLVKNVDADLNEILNSKDEFSIKTIKDSEHYVKILTTAFWTCAMITANMMCINSFLQSFFYEPTCSLENGRNVTSFPPVILRSWFPFEDQWENFSVVYWVQFYIMWLGMIIVPCQHVFIVGIMIFFICVLKILINQLENLTEIDQLVTTVKKHQRVKELARELESLITHALFLDFVVFSVLLCALLFQSSQSPLGVETFIFAMYIITMVTILWMYYWHANEIVYYSSLLSDAAYKSPWYTNSRAFNKKMLIFTTCAKPMKMYVGFLPMSLDTFLGILRASYSYFTILTQMAD